MESKIWSQVIREGKIDLALPGGEPLAEAVSIALKAVSDHLANSEEVKKFLTETPKGSGTNCPGSPVEDLVYYVAHQKGKMDKSKPRITLEFLKSFIQPVFELEREAVKAALLNCDQASPQDRNFILESFSLTKAVDYFYLRWFEKMVVPWQELTEADQKNYRLAIANLSEYDYTVFDYLSGQGISNRKTWIEAYPEEIRRIELAIQRLMAYGDDSQTNYLRALKAAYTCREIDKLEEVWRRVDEEWIKIQSSIVPVHGMESGYEHPRCVSPEFRMACRTSAYQEMIAETKNLTIIFASDGVSEDLIQAIKSKLSLIDMACFEDAVRAGVCMNFRYAGQAVPNRQEVLVNGGKIFIVLATQESAVAEYRRLLDKHCLPEASNILRPLVTEDAELRMTAGHECGHPVFRTAEIDATLGDSLSLLEEAKASGVGYLYWYFNDPSPETARKILAVVLSRICRTLHPNYLSNRTLAAYVRENLAMATILNLAGVIQVTNDGISVNWSKVDSGEWITTDLNRFIDCVKDCYVDGDQSGLETYADFYTNPENNQVAILLNLIATLAKDSN